MLGRLSLSWWLYMEMLILVPLFYTLSPLRDYPYLLSCCLIYQYYLFLLVSKMLYNKTITGLFQSWLQTLCNKSCSWKLKICWKVRATQHKMYLLLELKSLKLGMHSVSSCEKITRPDKPQCSLRELTEAINGSIQYSPAALNPWGDGGRRVLIKNMS